MAADTSVKTRQESLVPSRYELEAARNLWLGDEPKGAESSWIIEACSATLSS
jgi:hypothetical protein